MWRERKKCVAITENWLRKKKQNFICYHQTQIKIGYVISQHTKLNKMHFPIYRTLTISLSRNIHFVCVSFTTFFCLLYLLPFHFSYTYFVYLKSSQSFLFRWYVYCWACCAVIHSHFLWCNRLDMVRHGLIMCVYYLSDIWFL